MSRICSTGSMIHDDLHKSNDGEAAAVKMMMVQVQVNLAVPQQ